jgi:hypothetical protein
MARSAILLPQHGENVSDTSVSDTKRRRSRSDEFGVNVIGIRIGYALGGLGWLTCSVIAVRMGGEAWLNLLVWLFGSVIGWWAGILISPDPTEQGQFLSFRRAVSAFLSGFLLAKLDVLFQGAVARNLITGTFLGRILLFATACLICAQFTYVARHDLRVRQSHVAAQDASVAVPNVTTAQRVLRLVTAVFAIAAIGIVVMLIVPLEVLPEWKFVIALGAVSTLAFLASTDSVRKWLFGRTSSLIAGPSELPPG